MKRKTATENVDVASGGNILAGIWLVIAPFALHYGSVDTPLWNDIVLGIAIFILAMVRLSAPLAHAGVSWVNFVLGLWLIVAPFVLLYAPGPAIFNDIFVGIAVIILASWSAMAAKSARPPGPDA
jgi:hypothetical protein